MAADSSESKEYKYDVNKGKVAIGVAAIASAYIPLKMIEEEIIATVFAVSLIAFGLFLIRDGVNRTELQK